jgi:hypothetical protein
MSDREDVLCGCGWGRLACPIEQIPEHCPMCNFNLWDYCAINILEREAKADQLIEDIDLNPNEDK